MQKVNKFAINRCQLCTTLEQFNLQVIEYGNVVADINNTTETDFTHLYRLNYIVDGEVELVSNGRKVYARPNSVIILTPGTRTTIPNGGMVTLMFINFEVMNLHMRQSFNKKIDEMFPNHIVSDDNLNLITIFNSISSEVSRHQPASSVVIQALFQILFAEMIRYSKEGVTLEEDGPRYGSVDLFNQANNYINAHLSENIKVKDIAAYINVSENYLYKIFIKHCGNSPQQQILNYRINLSCDYLQNPSLAIKTIAEQLGFASYNHYSAAFRKVKGVSPSTYRKQLNGNIK